MYKHSNTTFTKCCSVQGNDGKICPPYAAGKCKCLYKKCHSLHLFDNKMPLGYAAALGNNLKGGVQVMMADNYRPPQYGGRKKRKVGKDGTAMCLGPDGKPGK